VVRLRPVWMTNHPPSVLWHCWLGHQTYKNRRPYNLYCVGADNHAQYFYLTYFYLTFIFVCSINAQSIKSVIYIRSRWRWMQIDYAITPARL